jgi:hypothetical protein
MIVFGSASLGSVVSSVSYRPYVNDLPRGDASDDVIEERPATFYEFLVSARS